MIKLSQILESKNLKKCNSAQYYHEHLIDSVFAKSIKGHSGLVDEDDNTLVQQDIDKRDDVIELIKTNKFDNNPYHFYKSLGQSKHQGMLTNYSLEDLNKMHTFKLEGYNIGFALKQFEDKGFSEIVALHNNEPSIKGIGELLVKSAVSNGGKYLDHFDGFLTGLYSKLGFEEYKRDKYNENYISNKEDFEKKYGKPDVIYRKYKG